jgi:thiol-disulfide isomerase/thioredoxin
MTGIWASVFRQHEVLTFSRYSDGVPLQPYKGDRSYADLSKYIEEQSTLYARGQPGTVQSSQDAEVVSSGFGRPNTEGKVLEVGERELTVLKENGPILVEFFAPWCGQ